MATTIKVLSEHTINQIAAGEVIENPASVVKELVENSLDAGSTKIIVEILGGGLQMIRISDDGKGMGPDDAVLCLERYATSKIFKPEDLCTISTMGFRGEALASIASISKMTLQTALPSQVGTQVDLEGGLIKSVKPCARNQGTTIEVKQLFYNVPARRKFQKSPALCFSEITKVITQLSLANPFIVFELYHQGEESLKLHKETGSFLEVLKKRAEKVLGDAFLENSVLVESSFSSFTFRGILGGVQNTRPNRSLQYSFVNQRAVLCPAISYAIKDAFRTRMEMDRFPIYVLHMDIPSDYLDVNVHPQKKEIRLREEKWIQKKVQEKIAEELFSKETNAPLSFRLFSPESFFQKPLQEEKIQEDFFEKEEEKLPFQPPLFTEKKVEAMGVFEHFLWVVAKTTEHLGLGFDLDGVLVIDLKASSSKILFESLKGDKKSGSQALFLPLTFSAAPFEVSKIASELPYLEKMGFSLRASGKHSFLIEAIPTLLKEKEALEFLSSFASEVEGNSNSRDRQLARSCHRVFARDKEPYSLSRALEILYELAKTECPIFCPLGNKTIVRLGNDELEQLFAKKR